jgi:hypothetical protein
VPGSVRDDEALARLAALLDLLNVVSVDSERKTGRVGKSPMTSP